MPVTLGRDALWNDVDHLARAVGYPAGRFQSSYPVGQTGQDFCLAVAERGLAVYEATADIARVLAEKLGLKVMRALLQSTGTNAPCMAHCGISGLTTRRWVSSTDGGKGLRYAY